MKKGDHYHNQMSEQGTTLVLSLFYYLQMTRGFKLGAVVLVFTFLTCGLSAFAACLRGAATTPECCGAHSVMAKTQLDGTGLQAKLLEKPCCNLSSGKPVPATVAQEPVNPTQGAPVLAALEPNACALLPAETELRDPAPTFRTSPPRSVLCTFLI